MATQHGGLALIRVQEGSGPLAPGEFRNLKLQMSLSDAIKPGHAYSGTWAVANLRYPVRLEVPNLPAGKKEVQ